MTSRRNPFINSCNRTVYHPLMHMWAHATSEYEGRLEVPRHDQQILRAIAHYRAIPWISFGNVKELSDEMLEWMNGTPLFREWCEVRSPLRAPEGWPGEPFIRCWLPYPPPTPFELANTSFYQYIPRGREEVHQVASLYAYCQGLDFETQAKIMGEDVGFQVMEALAGARRLAEDPQVRLWLLNPHWPTVRFPADFPNSGVEREELVEQLQNRPRSDKDVLWRLTSDPIFKINSITSRAARPDFEILRVPPSASRTVAPGGTFEQEVSKVRGVWRTWG